MTLHDCTVNIVPMTHDLLSVANGTLMFQDELMLRVMHIFENTDILKLGSIGMPIVQMSSPVCSSFNCDLELLK